VSDIRVLIAESCPIICEGLKKLIQAREGLQIVGEVADAATLATVATALQPDIVIIEALTPGDGVKTVARIRQGLPGGKVLALTSFEEPLGLQRLREAGAAVYVRRRATLAQVLDAVLTVAAGRDYLDPKTPLREVALVPAVAMSHREEEVMRMIAQGHSNKQIAATLQISVKTVETYKIRAMEKLGFRGRVDLVRYAAGNGWLNENTAPVMETPTPMLMR